MRFFYLLIIFSLTYPVVAIGGKIQSVVHIYNGKEANPHSHPWLLNFEDCTANLIRVPYLKGQSDIAITAAHCVNGWRLNKCKRGNAWVVAGNHHLVRKEADERKEKVSDIRCAVYFRFMNDIAILKLVEPIAFNKNIQPIDLPDEDEEIAPGTICTVAGWGGRNYSINEIGEIIFFNYPRVVHEINITIAADSVCKDVSKPDDKYPYNETTMICQNASADNKHPLVGDSGAALHCKKNGKSTLYGIVSAGDRRKTSSVIDVTIFTKVSKFRKWIDTEIAQMKNTHIQKKGLLQKTFFKKI